MPSGEEIARAWETSCCRYFRYSSADESATIVKQAIAIPAYFNIFLITFSSAKQFPSHLYEQVSAFVPLIVSLYYTQNPVGVPTSTRLPRKLLLETLGAGNSCLTTVPFTCILPHGKSGRLSSPFS